MSHYGLQLQIDVVSPPLNQTLKFLIRRHVHQLCVYSKNLRLPYLILLAQTQRITKLDKTTVLRQTGGTLRPSERLYLHITCHQKRPESRRCVYWLKPLPAK